MTTILKFSLSEYKEFDKKISSKVDKYEAIRKYNKENGTNFHYATEFIHKLYDSLGSQRVADILFSSRSGIIKILEKMGVERKSCGGQNNLCDISEEAINDIRTSKESQEKMAAKYGISQPTVGHIRNKKHRWAEI